MSDILEKDLENEEMEVENATEESAAESKSEKFKRLSGVRIRNAAKAINSLGNLATSAYEYTPEDVEKMFSYLQKQLDEVKTKYEMANKKFDEFNW